MAPLTPNRHSRLMQLRDVDATSFVSGDVPVWDADLQKFVGGAPGGGPGGGETDPVATAALTVHEADEDAHGLDVVRQLAEAALTEENDPVAMGTIATHAGLQPAHGGDLAGAPRPPTAHNHPMGQVTGLAEALDALASDTDVATAVGALTDALAANAAADVDDPELQAAVAQALEDANDAIAASSSASAAALVAAVALLEDALDGKAPVAHTHTQAEVLDLVDALAAKADGEDLDDLSAAVDGEIAARAAADTELHGRIDADRSWRPWVIDVQVPMASQHHNGPQSVYDADLGKTFEVHAYDYGPAFTDRYIGVIEINEATGERLGPKRVGSYSAAAGITKLDAHGLPSLVLDGEKRIHVLFAEHETSFHWCKSPVAGTIAGVWTDDRQVALPNATYCSVDYDAVNECCWLFYRQGVGHVADGGGANGDHEYGTLLRLDDGAGAWVDVRAGNGTGIVDLTGHPDARKDVYMPRVFCDQGRVGIGLIIAHGDTHDHIRANAYFAWYDPADDHLYDAAGVDLGTVVTWAEMDAATALRALDWDIALPAATDRVRTMDLFIHPDTHEVMLCLAAITADGTGVDMRALRWTGAAWTNELVTTLPGQSIFTDSLSLAAIPIDGGGWELFTAWYPTYAEWFLGGVYRFLKEGGVWVRKEPVLRYQDCPPAPGAKYGAVQQLSAVRGARADSGSKLIAQTYDQYGYMDETAFQLMLSDRYQPHGAAAPLQLPARQHPKRATAKGTRNANQTLTSGAITDVLFTTEAWATEEDLHSVAALTERFPIPFPGVWEVTVVVPFAGVAGNRRWINLLQVVGAVATSILTDEEAGLLAGNTLGGTVTIMAAMDDYVKLQAFQQTGANLDVIGVATAFVPGVSLTLRYLGDSIT